MVLSVRFFFLFCAKEENRCLPFYPWKQFRGGGKRQKLETHPSSSRANNSRRGGPLWNVTHEIAAKATQCGECLCRRTRKNKFKRSRTFLARCLQTTHFAWLFVSNSIIRQRRIAANDKNRRQKILLHVINFYFVHAVDVTTRQCSVRMQ